MKIVTVVGARPQFIKAAPVSEILRKSFREYIIHTGQHYDDNMSRIFFDDLQIPRPDINLNVGSGRHAEQTGRMLIEIERVLQQQKPDLLLVYGDTNSTFAGALCAAKLHIPIAHVEAGLRSFNRKMPEEINRILTDQISAFLFCPTQTSVNHLKTEGVIGAIHLVGDVMYDAALKFGKIAERKSTIMSKLGLKKNAFLLATVHRPNSTDTAAHLGSIIEAFEESDENIVFPIHPRTRNFLQKYKLWDRVAGNPRIMNIDPVSYLDMLVLEKHAKKILTDSGGIQKEAYFYQIPCITMREETEWVETVEDGWNIIVGTDKMAILRAIKDFNPNSKQRSLFGNGDASININQILVSALKS
ncbi:UDP-N-acetylglucosamine 2-epimerase (non-hydrolyzing) [candidate division KSB1 bacterium]|nr:UDP-N-acetylglucosamine 2-epimerase (non-hydrolyzing) [candidate division KSB1 bacterium]